VPSDNAGHDAGASAGGDALAEAIEAVRQEYRETTRPALLACKAMTPVGGGEGVQLVRIDISGPIDFDWTWEGSVVSPGPSRALEDEAREAAGCDWHGELVEVEPVRGYLYVVLEGRCPGPDETPRTVIVEPFPFVRPLHQIFAASAFAPLRGRLEERLLWARGEPCTQRAAGGSSSVPALASVWQHRWAILWGPPGTGKTFTIGEQVALQLGRPGERILVVSTTNKATDAVAISVGQALDQRLSPLLATGVKRLGRGADQQLYEERGMTPLLAAHDGQEDARRLVAEILRAWRRSSDAHERAALRARLRDALNAVDGPTTEAALDTRTRVVVITAYSALALLATDEMRELITSGAAPFTSVILDEAGLLSRAVAAALSLFASERTLLVGDPKQLAPITRICRVMAPQQAAWLAESALGHLRPAQLAEAEERPAIAMLRTQHRMAPAIRDIVSRYQYGGMLEDSEELGNDRRPAFSSELFQDAPRAIWYVIDEDGHDEADLRAERGPGQRSWIRRSTPRVLERLLAAAPELARMRCLLLSPFVAQAQSLNQWLGERELGGWQSSTVHAQQGAEADIVVFDTVNAGSYLWPPHEWQRIINVAMSRARELAIVVASRKEMDESYLRRLKQLLEPRVLEWRGRRYLWRPVERDPVYRPPLAADPSAAAQDPSRLGAQLEARRSMRPLLTREQEQLCRYRLDGKPRLVRGVAGSGKTVVLAHWLARTARGLRSAASARIWVIYGNRALAPLLWDSVEEAWLALGERGEFPRQLVDIRHVRDVLRDLHVREALPLPAHDFDYDALADALTAHDARNPRAMAPLCDALFIDEAQDFGHRTLALLFRLVRPSSTLDSPVEAPDAPHVARNVFVFYDSAQNLYQRSRPTWSELGLDLRGRSTVLKESYRATRPICELALNVLCRLAPQQEESQDHRELEQRGLISRTRRHGRSWWRVHYNDIGGPPPVLRRCPRRQDEVVALAERVAELVRDQGVRPADIRVLYLGGDIGDALVAALGARLAPLGARVLLEKSQRFTTDSGTVVVTTPQSFKGYDAEVVLVAGADRFRSAERGVLAETLYVALTRARSVLEIYASTTAHPDGSRIVEALDGVIRDAHAADASEA
jgi:superfamily I DNA/RNA helicase